MTTRTVAAPAAVLGGLAGTSAVGIPAAVGGAKVGAGEADAEVAAGEEVGWVVAVNGLPAAAGTSWVCAAW